jgi:GTP-binding protein
MGPSDTQGVFCSRCRMKITGAEFLKSAFEEKDWPRDSRPEIAFLGRSNIGKSSLINSLLGVRGLARTSRTPGRTQSLNFFLINDLYHFVDLPGYGFARVPETIRKRWQKLATDYLAKRRQLVLSIQIVDSRHKPAELDLQLHDWLEHHQKSYIIVATKSDKLSQNELRKNIERYKSTFKADKVLTYSATTGVGREELWKKIEAALRNSRTGT